MYARSNLTKSHQLRPSDDLVRSRPTSTGTVLVVDYSSTTGATWYGRSTLTDDTILALTLTLLKKQKHALPPRAPAALLPLARRESSTSTRPSLSTSPC